jgi:imidazolonepropionase-like amidohydrolase
VRVQLKNGADFIKVYADNIRDNPATGCAVPTMTFEEEQAIVDETHRQGAKAACTAHAGIGVRQSILAGCDSLELVLDIDEESVRMVAERGIFMDFGLISNRIKGVNESFPHAEMSKASFQSRPDPVLRACSSQALKSPAGTDLTTNRIQEKPPPLKFADNPGYSPGLSARRWRCVVMPPIV